MIPIRNIGTLFIALLSQMSLADNWVPFSLDWDKAPVDLSFLLDPPAGKHGFLGIKNNRFVFEDGTEIRFWGIAMTGSACFPPHDRAPRIASRLSKFGINLVRFHQLDAHWAEPNLFAGPSTSRQSLNPEAIDRLDFFIQQLENRGIYVWLDGLASRKLVETDGLLFWKYIPPGLKGYIYFVPEFIKLHQQYLFDLWSHRNRYSRFAREYRDNPAIVLTELFHDNNLFLDIPRESYYLNQLGTAWTEWNKVRGVVDPPPLDWNRPFPEMRDFITGVMIHTNRYMFNYLRQLSVKIPIAATSRLTTYQDLLATSFLDFTHAEGYWNEPSAIPNQFDNRSMAQIDTNEEGNLFSQLALSRMLDKPFLVSAWGDPWPNEYRAELPLWISAMASFQDWQGCIFSPYQTNLCEEDNPPLTSTDAFNDPCVFGLMPAAALLFHRKHIDTAKRELTIAMNSDTPFADDPIGLNEINATRLVSQYKMQTGIEPMPSGRGVLSPTQPTEEEWELYRTDTKNQLRHDAERGLIVVDAKQTQALIGRLNQAKLDDLSGFTVETDEEFGVCGVSSIDGKPVRDSQNLWITIVSAAQNTHFKHTQAKGSYRIENAGTAPVLIRQTPVRLFIQTRHRDWIIEAVDGNGSVIETLPYQYEKNRLSFLAGVHPTLFYRLSCTDK